jgi:hypothetical protein
VTSNLPKPNPVVGVDLDNTLAMYDGLMHTVALEMNLITTNTEPNKKSIRDAIRLLPEGEIEWQKLQGVVYGPRMYDALVAEGAVSFFQECKRQASKVFVISHKTQYANYDLTNTNLHESAMQWMIANRFFDPEGLALVPNEIYMEETRQAKLEQVALLGCEYFVDDLEEVFLEPSFPNNVQGILYHPDAKQTCPPGVQPATCWDEISEYIFGS